LDQPSAGWAGDFRVALDFVIDPVTKNAPLLTAESCMQNASNNGRIKVRGLPD
jgi:hypothetical protein